MKTGIYFLWTLSFCYLPLQAQNTEFSQHSGIYNIRDFGAVANGVTLDTKAINEAISQAARAGGGIVLIPAGQYLTGSIHLQSNITLYLSSGTRLIAVSDNPETNYDQAEISVNSMYQDYGHSHWHNALIWGDSLHDVSIIGPGEIYGKGLVKEQIQGSKSADKTISLHWCKNVILRDLTIRHGGWFAILVTGVDNLTIDNLKIDTNRDGMDIDCCKNVRITDCFVNSPFDDGICLKSSFALGYARSTDNVTITGCQVSGYDEGTLLDGTYGRKGTGDPGWQPTGRIKFGTESNGGFRNITVSNCLFDYCGGFALESVDGATLENVAITNIAMRDVVNDPLFIRLGSRMRGPANTPVGTIRHLLISHITANCLNPESSCTISGLPGHPVEDIQLSDIRIQFTGGADKNRSDAEIPEVENHYPEPGMFGPSPAYGLFVRHARDIRLSDVEFTTISADERSAFRFDDVNQLYMHHISTSGTAGSVMSLLNRVTGFSLFQSHGLSDRELQQANHLQITY